MLGNEETKYAKQNIVSIKDAQVLIPRTCEYVRFHSRGETKVADGVQVPIH
jgi:hypothetical protein